MTGNSVVIGTGLLFILVGPGGVGKNTLMEAVLPRFDYLTQLATVTTRAVRPNEVQGKHHVFVTLDEFKRLIEANELVEYEQVHPGKYYGVPRSPLEQAILTGHDLIADIEVSGAAKVRAAYPHNTIVIFIKPPSLEVLAERMRARGEKEAGIVERMERAAREMTFANQCNHVIINDEGEFERAIEQLFNIITEERRRRESNTTEGMTIEGGEHDGEPDNLERSSEPEFTLSEIS